MTVQDRTALRSAYLYLVCLITLVMVIFAAVNLVRNAVELAYPDRGAYAYEPFYGPEGEELSAEERRLRDEALQESQRRQAVLGIVGSATLLLIAGPAYVYHWRRVQSELRRGAAADEVAQSAQT